MSIVSVYAGRGMLLLGCANYVILSMSKNG